jgi:peroxiredoxin
VKWRGISADSATEPAPGRPLAERLLELRAGIAQYVRPENQQINEQTVAWLHAECATERALKAGEKAPDFTLPDQNGNGLSSADRLRTGPLVAVFFRGRWCPFCVASLEAWRDAAPQVIAAGAKLVGISPQSVHQNSLTADQHRLNFPLLSDSGNQVAEQFGVRYRVPQDQERLYRSSFVNLPHINGDASWTLPMPALFVIGGDGKIATAKVEADYRERADPAVVLATLNP